MRRVQQERPALLWATEQLGGACTSTALKKAASKRCYFRVKKNTDSWILMDASEEIESSQSFVQVNKLFSGWGLRVPQIEASCPENGWLLTEDFGQQRLLEELQNNPQSADHWYRIAWKNIQRLQTTHLGKGLSLPMMDVAWARRESMRAIDDYFPSLPKGVQASLDKALITQAIDDLSQAVIAQPFCLSHRDFHSENLMCLGTDELGILDFQSAFYAPMTYDIASLLRDCYIDWPLKQANEWLRCYYYDTPLWKVSYIDYASFKQAFDETSLQRHLKCLGLFVHLVECGQPSYAGALPRTLGYAQQVCENNKRWRPILPLIEAGMECMGI